jgi:hypothetical protein
MISRPLREIDGSAVFADRLQAVNGGATHLTAL